MLEAARQYLDLGLDAIPLRAGSKRPLAAGWRRVPAQDQWQGVGGQEVNIGLRMGGAAGLAAIDSDDKHAPTWAKVQNFLFGLGLEPGAYPVHLTPHGGRHALFTLTGDLSGDLRLLRADLGAGEVRYGAGAIIAAPPSTLPDGDYRRESGDLRQLPRIRAADLLPILAAAGSPHPTRTQPPRAALELLHGRNLERYATRSEAEAAAVAHLVNAGVLFEDIARLFIQFPAAGKFQALYQEQPAAALRWLRQTYEAAQAFTATPSPGRLAAERLLEAAQRLPWPGVTGSTDRAVYLAHLYTARAAGGLTYSASIRQLAEQAGVMAKTVSRANARLLSSGFLTVERESVATLANVYVLQNDYTTLKNCEVVGSFCNIAGHDLFRRRGGLGLAAGEVYAALLRSPEGLTAGGIVTQTGRDRATVWRVLRAMRSLADRTTGELFPMVEQGEGKRWRALDADFDALAFVVGSAGRGRKQREQHRREQEKHRRELERGRQDDKDGS